MPDRSRPARADSGSSEARLLRTAAETELNPRLKRRLIGVAGLLDGLSLSEAARRFGLQRHSLRSWYRRYRHGGLPALMDRARPGRPSRLDDRQKAELLRAVRAEGLAGDVAAVQRLIAERFGVAYSLSGTRKLLQALGAPPAAGRDPAG